MSPDDSVATLEEWMELADEEDRPALQQAIHAHLTSERSHFEIEYRLRHVRRDLPLGAVPWHRRA